MALRSQAPSFLPFAAALVAWIIVSRAWKLLAGAAASLALSSALASLLYPHAWLDYERLLRSPTVENDLIPCTACALRKSVGRTRLAP